MNHTQSRANCLPKISASTSLHKYLVLSSFSSPKSQAVEVTFQLVQYSGAKNDTNPDREIQLAENEHCPRLVFKAGEKKIRPRASGKSRDMMPSLAGVDSALVVVVPGSEAALGNTPSA